VHLEFNKLVTHSIAMHVCLFLPDDPSKAGIYEVAKDLLPPPPRYASVDVYKSHATTTGQPRKALTVKGPLCF
jgi:hypothetical protein